MSVLFEVCIDSVASALAAERGGGKRLELCDNLVQGGTTPSIGMIEAVLDKSKLPLMVIVRPRSGDFLYSDDEFEIMCRDIYHIKKLGVHGIVIGILTADGSVDLLRMKELLKISGSLSVTFHRAFDMVKNSLESMEQLIDLGIDRILTSGQSATAWEGRELIKVLQEKAGGRIEILPGGGINHENVKELIEYTRVKSFHASGRETIASQMNYRKEGVNMGLEYFSEYELRQVSESNVRAMVIAANEI